MDDAESRTLRDRALGRRFNKWIRDTKNHQPTERYGPELCSFCKGEEIPRASLCGQCQRLGDISHLLFCSNGRNPASSLGESLELLSIRDAEESLLSNIAVRKDTCAFCRILLDSVAKKWSEDYPNEDRLDPYQTKCTIDGPLWLPGLLDFENLDPDCYQYRSVFRVTCYRLSDGDRAVVLDLPILLSYPFSSDGSFSVSKWASPAGDLSSLTLAWLNRCKGRHKKHCGPMNEISYHDLPRHFRLIDVKDMCVVAFARLRPFRYLALSYVWGQSSPTATRLKQDNIEQLSKVGALRQAKLPNTITDAIALCASLGVQYLWVDTLCIIQGPSNDDYHQILAMDKVYALAELTIVAAAGPDADSGLPGVNGRLRPHASRNETRPSANLSEDWPGPSFRIVINQSVWSSRGWTFQEHLLSPRCLFFTEYQAFWQCRSATIEEEHGLVHEFGAVTSPAKNTNFLFNPHERNKYEEAVQAYSKRSLSYHSDVTNAFTGICNVLSPREAHSLLGRSLAPLLGIPRTMNHLVRALLWDWQSLASKRPDSDFPAWSWVSWMGPISFPILHSLRIGQSKISHAHIQVRNGHLTPWNEPSPPSRANTTPTTGPVLSPNRRGFNRAATTPALASEPSSKGRGFFTSERIRELSSEQPDSLVFFAKCAKFRLEHVNGEHMKSSIFNKIVSYQGHSLPFKVPLAIVNDSGDAVGFMHLNEYWGKIFENPDARLEFAAIALAKPKGKHRDGQSQPGVYNLMMAMLVQRGKDRYATRLGIAVIDSAAWEAANPIIRVNILV